MRFLRSRRGLAVLAAVVILVAATTTTAAGLPAV